MNVYEKRRKALLKQVRINPAVFCLRANRFAVPRMLIMTLISTEIFTT